MNLTRNVAILCIALVISSLSGCDKPRPDGMPDLVGCTITLNYSDGKPAQDVTVVLTPVSQGLDKWPSAGKTDASGKAKIVTYGQYPGAPEGEYKIVLKKVETARHSLLYVIRSMNSVCR